MSLNPVDKVATKVDGYVSTIRYSVRQDMAHYAGDLVNGAAMLSVFGDLATELAIVSDGDEGLFRPYEHVDFLAPIYAGDFIEARGWYSKVGKTSRLMQFEAWKFITLVKDKEPNAADLLAEPVLVARATGVTVVPKPAFRKAFVPHDKMVANVLPKGAEWK